MDFDKDEEKIKSLLQAYSGNPPEELMKNYVAEVRKKIQAVPQRSVGFGMPLVLLLIAVSLAGAFVLMKPAPKKAAPEKAVLQSETPVQAAPQPEDFEKLLQQVEEQADFEEISESLMILELLGEDEGITDDSGTVEADVEFFAGG